MAQLKSTKVFGDLNVTGEVNVSTKITVNGEEVWDTGNLLNIGTTAATARTALGLGAGATRWPTFAEVTGKPATYTPSGHTHTWSQITGVPVTATRWPTKEEIGLGSVVNRGSERPVGEVAMFAQFGTPDGWLGCFGQTVLISDYPRLFQVIGKNYGGDGITNFKLPDLRGNFVRGFSAGVGVDSARVFGSIQEDEVKGHSHSSGLTWTSGSGDHYHTSGSEPRIATTSKSNSHEGYASFNSGASTAAAGGVETRPRNIALYFCIRAYI